MKKILFVFMCLSFLTACNQNAKQTETAKEEGESSSQSVENVNENKNSNGCFMEYQNKPCQLITKEFIAETFGIDAASIKQSDNMETMKSNPTMFACRFEVAEGAITVGQIEETELGLFKFKYKEEYLPKDQYDLEYMEGFGESAAYVYKKDSKNTNLTVFQKGSLFKIVIYGNQKSQEENLAIAKKVAVEVLKKCN